MGMSSTKFRPIIVFDNFHCATIIKNKIKIQKYLAYLIHILTQLLRKEIYGNVQRAKKEEA
jgi:hypothetical protein